MTVKKPNALFRLSSQLSIVYLKLIAQLPLAWLLHLGRGIGTLLYYVLTNRTAITRRNIQACFPELSTANQELLIKECIRENACGLLESAKAWWGNMQPILEETEIIGLDIILQAINSKQGCLLIGAHYTTLDMGGRLLAELLPVNIIYRPFNNLDYNQAILNARSRFYTKVIEKNKMRDLVRSLQAGGTLWYPADQDYGLKDSVFAPFFGISAATLATTAGLAKLAKGQVVGILHHRLPNNRYRVEFIALPDFPTNDPVTAATRANELIEKGIRFNPAQYMWVHRRFKTRPEHEPNFYS